MLSSIWDKYSILKEINKNSYIKTYLTKIEPIVKEIIPKNHYEFLLIKERLESIKNIIKIYDIIEENDIIYAVIDNDDELISKFDKLMSLDELTIKKESVLKTHGKPVSKKEILDLFDLEKSMCKIFFQKIENKKINEGSATGFFCELYNFPIKYALFTSNHVLDEKNTKLGNIINIEYFKKNKIVQKKIKINEKRKVFTNKELDYTCIQLFESDEIKYFFKIDPILFSEEKNCLENSEIFILQYPLGNELSFSYGKILSLEDEKIIHSASTEQGSSGSPIIRRCKDNYLIGLHCGGIIENNNYGIEFKSILNDINPNAINCSYLVQNNFTKLIYSYGADGVMGMVNNQKAKEYQQQKKLFLEDIIDIYINDKKIDFNFFYEHTESKEIKVKYIFKKKIANMELLFCNTDLKSIDFSSFDSSNVTDVGGLFWRCYSLESINLSSFNTSNVTDMSGMFNNCRSLKTLDLSSFNTNKVTSMTYMFHECSSLESINLSSFKTNNLKDMSYMFSFCRSLKSLNLSSFNTNNVNEIKGLFIGCCSLQLLDLSSFNERNIIDIKSDLSFYHGSPTNLKIINKYNKTKNTFNKKNK